MKKSYILFGIVIVGMLSFLIFRPGITGNVIAEGASGEELSCDDQLSVNKMALESARLEIESCAKLKDAAIADLGKLDPAESRCDTSELEARVAELTKQRSGIMLNLKEAQDAAKECDRISDLEASYNELARNSANNICCKARIDNNAINSYRVESNRITCGENIENPLSCP